MNENATHTTTLPTNVDDLLENLSSYLFGRFGVWSGYVIKILHSNHCRFVIHVLRDFQLLKSNDAFFSFIRIHPCNQKWNLVLIEEEEEKQEEKNGYACRGKRCIMNNERMTKNYCIHKMISLGKCQKDRYVNRVK